MWYFYIFWFPEYLKRVRHFDLAGIGKVAWIPFMVAGFGNVLGGLLSGYLLKRGWSVTAARKTSVTFFCVLMMSAIPAVLAGEAWLSIAFVSVAMLGYTGGLANMLTIPSDVYPKNAVASVYGLASMGSGFGGMLFTLITGWVVDHYSYTPVFHRVRLRAPGLRFDPVGVRDRCSVWKRPEFVWEMVACSEIQAQKKGPVSRPPNGD